MRFHRPVRLQSCPFAIILPQEAASKKFPSQSNYEQKVDDELEETEEADDFFSGWIPFFRTNLFSSCELLLALLLALQPGLVQLLLLEFVFVVTSV